MQCVFSGFPLRHVMSGIAQTMLGWCKCTLTYRLFLVLPSVHLKDALPSPRQIVRLPARIDVSHQKAQRMLGGHDYDTRTEHMRIDSNNEITMIQKVLSQHLSDSNSKSSKRSYLWARQRLTHQEH